MTEYVYPALFHPNSDGSFTILFPDLPGCISEGKSLANAMYMAQDALTQWIEYLTDKKEPIPPPSDSRAIQTEGDQFVNLIRAELKEGRAVKRTVSLPQWLDEQASTAGLSLSRILQDALKERLNVN